MRDIIGMINEHRLRLLVRSAFEEGHYYRLMTAQDWNIVDALLSKPGARRSMSKCIAESGIAP